MACRDWYRGAREQLIALGLRQGHVTHQQLSDYMPDDITDRQILRWLAALEARGIVIRQPQNEDNTCAL
ncbi:MAG: hypothetical protein H0V17_27595 [Deltaproteobacteria bacterium]|nr:hypothetical protein [Deltaproteobacteria bacterium]